MGNPRQVALLQRSVEEFNQWRSRNPNKQADLRESDLHGAPLGGANLIGANLIGANLRGANLGAGNLGGANLRGTSLIGTNLDRASLIGANLRGANLRGANLGGADLGEANLRRANLGGADLGGANLGGADLSEAKLHRTKLRRAYWDEQTVWPDGFEPPSHDSDPDLPAEPDSPAPAIGVRRLERSRHFPDEQTYGTVLQAVESLLAALGEYRDPEHSPLKPNEWAQLDANCSTLESQLRHPTGNALIINAAADDALAAVRPYLDLEEDTSPEVRDLLEVAEGIGNEDPAEAGDHAKEVLDRAMTTPPTDDAGEEPTKKLGERTRETAREAALRGIDSGVEEAIRKLITGTPHAVANAVGTLGLWAYGGAKGAAIGVAWAIIRIVIGSFKRRPE